MALFKNKTFKFIALIVLAFVLVCSAGVFTALAKPTADELTFTGTIDERYSVGDTVTIPVGKVGDTVADYRIVLPDGTYSQSQTLKIQKTGNYKIEYTAVVDGKVFKETKTFLVGNELFTLTGMGSGKFLSINESGAYGMYFNLYNGDSIAYNDVVDLNELSGEKDTLFKVIPMVTTPGEPEITQFNVTLSDIYNEENTITVRYKHSIHSSVITYIDASFNGNAFCGMDTQFGSSSKEYLVQGIKGIYQTIDGVKTPVTSQSLKAWINHSKYGRSIMNGFAGGTKDNPQNYGKEWLGMAFDTQTNILYAMSSSRERYVVADFNNASIFGETFGGFTGNKVKITITPIAFNKGSCGFFISEIAGNEITENICNSYVSTCEPELSVDYGEYTNATVPAVKKGNTYKLFNATAIDPVEGELSVQTSVYYGYNNRNPIRVSVVNDSFVADRVGVYTVIYSVTNSNGKTVTESYNVTSYNNSEKLSLALGGEPDYSVSIHAGESVKVHKTCFVQNFYGNVNVSVCAVLESDSSVRFELNDKNDYTFVPVVSGVYKIIYQVSDYSETNTITRDLTVVPSDEVYYETTENFPDYLIKNGNYKTDVINAYTLNTGKPVKQDVLTFIEDVNGTLVPVDKVVKIIGDYVLSDNTVKLVYKPNINVPESEYFVKQIPVIDTGLYTEVLDNSKYLVNKTGSFDFVNRESNIDCAITSLENGKASFSFINTLNANPFRIKLSALVSGEKFNAFDSLNVYIYDVVDAERYVKGTLFYKDGFWYVSVNDVKEIKVSDTWGDNDDYFELNYSSQEQKMIVNRFLNYSDIKFYGTNDPALFTNGVKLVVEVVGDVGCDGVKLHMLNGVVLSESMVDMSKATIDKAHDKNAGYANINDVITLNPYAVYDVFAPYLSCTVSVAVKLESGGRKNVTSIDNITLKNCDASRAYQFKLTEYGTYTVTISATDPDNSYNNVTTKYDITVINNVKPVVTMDTTTISAKVGESLKIPFFTVDVANYSSYITVKAPDSFITFVDISNATESTKDNGYVFRQAGEYIVTVIVYDANMNFTEISYKVLVK